VEVKDDARSMIILRKEAKQLGKTESKKFGTVREQVGTEVKGQIKA
jgi:hypothetical protein